jgi:mono/diheme cytochrome c family protein
MRDLRSPDVQKRTDADLTDLITNGLATMPAFKNKLTKNQIQQQVAYIRQIAKK